MTEFTSEFIAKQRAKSSNLGITIIPIIDYLEALDHIEHLQGLMLAYENDLVLLSVYGKLKRAEAEIKESNDLLRSAWMIAKRDGKDTNWEAFRGQLNIALERQHKIIYQKDKK